MKRVWKQIRLYRFELAFMAIAVLAAFSPYIRPDLIMGSDAMFHLARIDSLKEELLHGVFPVKLHSVLCYGYGYGVGFFYPNFFLYIPAAFRIMGFSLEVSYKLYAGVLLTALFCTMYYSVWRGTENRRLALLAGALFLFSNPVLAGFYHGFTLAQTQALVFMPLAIMGMFLFAARDEKPGMLAVGFTGLIFSHVLSTVLATAVCLILLLCYVRTWKKWKNKICQLLSAVIAVSCVTCAYWLPMLEQFLSQSFRVSQPWTHVYQNVGSVYRVLLEDGAGTVITGLSVCALLYLVQSGKTVTAEAKISLGLGVGMMLVITSDWFWNHPGRLLDFIQFPQRLKGPAVVLLIFSIVWCAQSSKLAERISCIQTALLLAFCMYFGLSYIAEDVENVKDMGNMVIYEEIAGIGAGEEWLPVETTREVLTTPMVAFSEEGKAFYGSRRGKDFYYTVDGTSAAYKIPLIWYQGYRAETADGVRLQIQKRENDGLISVYGIPQAQKTVIHLWYAGTLCQTASYLVSFLTVIVIMICGWKGRKQP